MLTLKSIEMGAAYKHGYGEGARPGMECKVEFQVGDKTYDRITVKLTPEATARIAAAIVAEATHMLVCDAGSIDVEGAPGNPTPEPSRAPADIEPI